MSCNLTRNSRAAAGAVVVNPITHLPPLSVQEPGLNSLQYSVYHDIYKKDYDCLLPVIQLQVKHYTYRQSRKLAVVPKMT